MKLSDTFSPASSIVLGHATTCKEARGEGGAYSEEVTTAKD